MGAPCFGAPRGCSSVGEAGCGGLGVPFGVGGKLVLRCLMPSVLIWDMAGGVIRVGGYRRRHSPILAKRDRCSVVISRDYPAD